MSDATADLIRLLGLLLVITVVSGALTLWYFGSVGFTFFLVLPAVLLFVACALVMLVVDHV